MELVWQLVAGFGWDDGQGFPSMSNSAGTLIIIITVVIIITITINIIIF